MNASLILYGTKYLTKQTRGWIFWSTHTAEHELSGPSKHPGQPPQAIWIPALAIAGLGTGILYNAVPGTNWPAWTLAAAACLILIRKPVPALRSPIVGASAVAIVIAGGAAVTASEFLLFLILIGIIAWLALAMLFASSPDWSRVTAFTAIPAPVIAFAQALVESGRRGIEAMQLVRSDRTRSIVGGIAITLPVVIIFALLLSSADPLFAGWRDALESLISSWEFLPRTAFFVALLSMVLGAYGLTARSSENSAAPADTLRAPARQWIGVTERLILIGSITALFSIFLIVQVTYLFGNLPNITGSGVTFADYARRGFAELTIVASASAFLIIVSEKFGKPDHRNSLLRTITTALIVAVLLLLGSAFHRVSLYEEAYGFTTARVYAQAYMVVVAIGLLALMIEVRGRIDTARLFRRAAAVATAALGILIYWNHEGWIAGRNIDRFNSTGKIDVAYLVRGLSPNAVPTIVSRMGSLPEPVATEIRTTLTKTYAIGRRRLGGNWYEWNRGRARAADALRRSGIVAMRATPPRPSAYP